MLILLYKIMKKNNYKADIIEEIGPKFMIQPYNVAKLQVRESGKTVAFQHTPKKNSNNFIYAQKFMKIQSRPSSSIPQSCRQGPKTVGFTCQQPRNMGMMGSFFVNTRPNTRRVSNSLANYHAQLKRKACSESNSRKKLQSAHILNRKDSSQKTMNKKTSADLLYENVINDMNQYFSLVKLSTYKRNEKKSKPGLKTGINSIFIDTTNPNISLNTHAEFMESPITEKRYMSTEIRTRQVQKQYTNMNIRALKPNNVRFSHNPRSQSVGIKNEKEKVDLTIKLITQELIPSSEPKIKQTSNKRFNFERQSPKRIPKTAITSNSLKKSQSNPKKKSSYLMEYFGKVKEIASLQQIQRFKALYYRDLIWKIWFNSGWRIKVESYSNSTIESPKYFVGRGNNSKLVKMLMGKRWWWKQETKEQNANFLWSQLKIYSAYQNQIEYEPVNVFEVDDEVQQIAEITPRTQKNNMEQEQKQIKSSQMTADLVLQNKIETIDFNIELSGIEISKFRENQKQKMQPNQEMYKKKQMQDTIRLEISPLKRSQKLELIESTKILSGSLQGQTQTLFDEQWCNNKLKLNDKNVYLLTFRKYKAWESYIKNINNYKRQSKSTQSLQARRLFDKNMQILDRFPNKVTNHLQYSRLIGNKKALYRTMSTYYQITKKISKFLPITYHITSGLQDQEYLKFLNEYYRRSKEQNNSMWIVKPGQMSNRGCGIKVCQDIQEIKKILKSKKTHTNGKPLTYIIQQYLRQPFLYQGRKFDIRHYIMINSTFGRIKGYWYQQGYIRTTSYKYSTKSQDSYIHLTNDAVQKYCKQYGKYQKGNKLSYEQFQKYLKALPEAKQKQYSFYDKILPKIRQISIDVINASYYIIDPKRKGNNFQIFGLDIMIDSEFRPYLIEVNTNPCLQLSSPVLAKVIPRMLDNAFAISLDPLFPPPCDVALGTKKNNLPQNYINENRFELVLDEVVEGKKLNRLYKQIKEQLSQMEGFGSDEQAYESAEDDFDAEC